MKISVQLFPYDSIDVEAILEQLAMPRQISNGAFITRYEVDDGHKYIQINNFFKHQNPHPKEKQSEIPAPNGKAVKLNYISRKAAESRENKLKVMRDLPDPGSSGSSGSKALKKPGAPTSRRASSRSKNRIAPNTKTKENKQVARTAESLVKEPIPEGVSWNAEDGVRFTDSWREYLSEYLKRYSEALDGAAKTDQGTRLTREEAQGVLEYLNERLLTDSRLRATERSNAAKWKQFRALVRNQFVRALMDKRKRERYPARASPAKTYISSEREHFESQRPSAEEIKACEAKHGPDVHKTENLITSGERSLMRWCKHRCGYAEKKKPTPISASTQQS